MKIWEHNELAEDLGDCKGTGLLDVPLGSVWLDNKSQRADVIEVKPSYTRFCVTIYEVKISRADFLSDIRSEKWKGYLEHCHRFYFACPEGIITKQDLPEGAGLIVRNDKGWHTVKAPKARNIELSRNMLLSLIFSKPREYHWIRKRLRVYREGEYSHKGERYRALGEKVSKALKAQEENLNMKSKYEYLIKKVREDICEGLGIEIDEDEFNWYSSPEYKLSELIREIKAKE